MADPRILLHEVLESASEAARERKRALGARIRAARVARGWKQRELAAAIHVEPITVSRWERGQHSPELDLLGRVADALDQPPAYFLPEDPLLVPPSPEFEAVVAAMAVQVTAIQAQLDWITAAVERLEGAVERIEADVDPSGEPASVS